ncbi:MAG: cell division protein FtsZ [Muribaculaceae bacterium]|nr:cell division protein FtsZ [Bacteroides sp.]MDE6680776.1 cell division protein FtsZ [Muribaculaceae bacterium]
MDETLDNIGDPTAFINDADPAIIKVIGVGGGGGNAVNYMFRQNIPNVNFVVVNTDKQALEMSVVPQRMMIGYEVTRGLGAGNKPAVGRQCAEASEQELRTLFSAPTEMVFITAGMGGGTGTGAAPVIARIAKDSGMLTIGIVTVPFQFEGKQKIIKALDGASEMRKHVDALLVINNENLIELYPDLNFFNAFEKADDTLANAARSISEIISERCYINVDFEDVKTTLKDSGTAIISTAYGSGEHRISEAINNALHSPLLKAHDINTSQRLLLKFTCSRTCKNPVRAEEINEITHFTSKLPSSIDVKWGIADDPAVGEDVKITVLASGFDVTLRDDDNEPNNRASNRSGSGSGSGGGNRIVMTADEGPTTEAKPQMEDADARIAEVYGQSKIVRQRQNTARLKYAVLKPGQFDDHDVITQIENTPAFNRPPSFNASLERLNKEPEPQPKRDQDTSGGQAITFDFGDDIDD